MTPDERINIAIRIASEELSLSRQWEQIGFAIVAATLAIVTLIVTKWDLLEKVSQSWTWCYNAAILILFSSFLLAAARYISISIIYYGIAQKRLSLVTDAINGQTVDLFNPALQQDPVFIQVLPCIFYLARRLMPPFFVYFPLFALFAVCLAIVTALFLPRPLKQQAR